jgi:outer membrane protein assembly factor BamB
MATVTSSVGDFMLIARRIIHATRYSGAVNRAILPTCLATVAVTIVAAQPSSWPQFGGPRGDFTVTGRAISLEWADGPAIRWSRDLGEGFSGIAAADDALFTMYRRGDEEVIVSLDAKTGRTRWEHGAVAPKHEKQDFSQGPGPHATPLISGNVVCAAGATARLRCLEAATGKLLWSRDLVVDNGATVVYRGYSSSPVAYGESIIVQAGGTGHAVMAFDRLSGKRLWASGDYSNTNSTPAILELAGRQQLVAFMVDVIAGFDPTSGDELWSHPHPQRFNDNIARPVLADGMVIASSALDGGTRALRVTRSGAGWRVEERWHQPRVGVYYTNIVTSAGLVLASSGGVGPTFFSALRADTGAIAWQSRDVLRSQMLAIGDELVLLRDEEGGLAAATVSTSGLRIRASAKIFAPGAPSPPTLIGTTLYARDRQRILSIDLSPR